MPKVGAGYFLRDPDEDFDPAFAALPLEPLPRAVELAFVPDATGERPAPASAPTAPPADLGADDFHQCRRYALTFANERSRMKIASTAIIVSENHGKPMSSAMPRWNDRMPSSAMMRV